MSLGEVERRVIGTILKYPDLRLPSVSTGKLEDTDYMGVCMQGGAAALILAIDKDIKVLLTRGAAETKAYQRAVEIEELFLHELESLRSSSKYIKSGDEKIRNEESQNRMIENLKQSRENSALIIDRPKNIQTRIQRLRQMKAEVARDLTQKGVKPNTPVCFYSQGFVLTHESTHGALDRLYPDLTDAESATERERIIGIAVYTFLSSLGPRSKAFVDKYIPRFPAGGRARGEGAVEEVLAAITGMSAGVRASNSGNYEVAEQILRTAPEYFATYARGRYKTWPVDQAELATMMRASATEFVTRYRSLTEAMQAFGRNHLAPAMAEHGVKA